MCGRQQLPRSAVNNRTHWLLLTCSPNQIHADQMRHVRKGCLTRPQQDLAVDGSRIESAHKAWNLLQRSFASGIETFSSLSHDFVLRRSIRLTSVRDNTNAFAQSTQGSHHIGVTQHIAILWNRILEKDKKRSTNLNPLPELPQINSSEFFGLGESKHVETFGGLMDVDAEHKEVEIQSADVNEPSEADLSAYLQSLDINPDLCRIPLENSSCIGQLLSIRSEVHCPCLQK